MGLCCQGGFKPCLCCVTLDNLLNFSEPLFPYLQGVIIIIPRAVNNNQRVVEIISHIWLCTTHQ